jgi:hypothetical protein
LRTADFNRDGKPDLVTTNLDDNTVSILLNDGKGSFRAAQPLSLAGCRGPDRIVSSEGVIAVTCASNNKLFVFKGGTVSVLDVPTDDFVRQVVGRGRERQNITPFQT